MLRFCISLHVFLSTSLLVAENPVVPLWKGKAPGAKGETTKDRPTLTVYLPTKEQSPNGAAVVIFPGGGYGHLAVGHEGKEIAQWLNANGIAAFVTRYRISPYRHPIPLTDAQRAMRLVRSRAAEWKIDKNRIGIIGFSAGGHLASTLSTHFDKGNPKADEPADKESCRPDFAIMGYPVISMKDGITHRGSKRNLLGAKPDAKLVQHLSNEVQVTKDTPPTFLWHTSQDRAVIPQNSVVYYLALQKARVPAEMHIFESGRHGVGLGKNIPGTRTWPALCITWLKKSGFLTSKK